MKTTHILLAAVLAATSAVQAATAERKLPAPLPEFKTSEQLAKWREEMAQKNSSLPILHSELKNATAFFTGKPFLSETGSYAFKFRQYDPELSRWTSSDPSGFPDGANASAYAPNPLSELDWCGLLAIVANSSSPAQFANSGITMTGLAWLAQTKKGNRFTVWQMQTVVNEPPQPPIPQIQNDFTMNCHGYVYLPGYWVNNNDVGTILADEWTLCDEKHARIVVYGGSEHSVKVTAHDANGAITEVTGKNGYQGARQSSLNGTGYNGPQFYE